MNRALERALREAGTRPASPRAEQVADWLWSDGWIEGLRPVEGEPPGSGARPWSRRLRMTSLDAIRQNQHLGVQYIPALALAPRVRSVRLLLSPESVLHELSARGAVLAYLPRPSWAIALCLGCEKTELAWFLPLPPALRAEPATPAD